MSVTLVIHAYLS